MRRTAIALPALALVALAVLPLAGCVSRSKLKETEALLAECRTDKVSAQNSSTACEERFAKEVKPQFLAGSLFRVTGLGIRGLPEPRFAG